VCHYFSYICRLFRILLKLDRDIISCWWGDELVNRTFGALANGNSSSGGWHPGWYCEPRRDVRLEMVN
jgi:hypothetical protein